MTSESTQNGTNPPTESPLSASENSGSATPGQSELEQLREELSQEKNKYLYLYAEFDTFKKRAIKERSDLLKYGHEPMVRELLSVQDNLDRSLSHTENLESFVQGVKMIASEFSRVLQKFQIQTISALGAPFDPRLHEAVGQEPVADPSQEGRVVREQQKGYELHGRLIRPARVIVGVKPS